VLFKVLSILSFYFAASWTTLSNEGLRAFTLSETRDDSRFYWVAFGAILFCGTI